MSGVRVSDWVTNHFGIILSFQRKRGRKERREEKGSERREENEGKCCKTQRRRDEAVIRSFPVEGQGRSKWASCRPSTIVSSTGCLPCWQPPPIYLPACLPVPACLLAAHTAVTHTSHSHPPRHTHQTTPDPPRFCISSFFHFLFLKNHRSILSIHRSLTHSLHHHRR